MFGVMGGADVISGGIGVVFGVMEGSTGIEISIGRIETLEGIKDTGILKGIGPSMVGEDIVGTKPKTKVRGHLWK
jgi:hypothetical protein